MQNTAKGQITLVSISDGSTALFYIDENESTEQVHNTSDGTYFPDYSVDDTNLVLTPVLTINGVVPTNVTYTWKEIIKGTETDIPTTSNNVTIASISSTGKLTIKSNLTSQQRFLKCTASFPDPVTAVTSTIVETVVLDKIDTAGNNVNVLLDCTTKDYVENKTLRTIGDGASTDDADDYVELVATTLYGTQVYVNGTPAENSNAKQGFIKYTWSYYNFHTNSFTQFGTNGGNSISGCLNDDNVNSYNTIDYFKKDPDETSSSSYSYVDATESDWTVMIKNNTMYLKPDAIDVNESIRCTALLNAVSNDTKGNEMGSDSDIQSVFDKTDDYLLDISADTTVLSTSVPKAILTATITRGGEELTTASYNQIYWDWDAYEYDTTSGTPSYVEWPEYSYDSSTKLYTRITKGLENGTGYWLTGFSPIPDELGTVAESTTGLVSQLTGGKGNDNRKVTVYRDLVGTNSRVCVVAYLNGINAKA